MRLPDHMRTTQGLGELLIETPSGWIPLRRIAEVVETDGPNQILRENQRRRVVVLANVRETVDMSAVIARIRAEIAATPLPPGVFTSLEGTFQAQEEASRRILVLSLASLALILAILYSRYRSLTLALIVMGTIPMAFIGSVAALWMAGQPLSVASMIGFITLTGIAARNGILKVSHTINLAIAGASPFGPDLVIRASLERMTPVLMTALSAGVALLPLTIDPTAPGKEILHPVAVTIFGGLLTATLLDAVITPLLLLRFARGPVERLVAFARSDARDGLADRTAQAY
jgi:HME family heavy-metal exporter